MTGAARPRLAAAALAILAAWPLAAANAQPLQPIPAFSAHVVDGTGTLPAAEKAALESKLAAFQAAKGAQIAVLVVATTAPEEIEQYSIRVVEAWRIGREEPDDGALLLVAKDDRALRIEVGRGLEGALTDLVSNRIIDETIVPRFREGDFAGGIAAGVDRMIAVVNGEPLPPPDANWKEGPRDVGQFIPFLFFVVIFVSGVLRAMFGRALGSVATGGVAGAAAWVFTKLLGISIGAGAIGLVLSLLLGFGNGGRWASRSGRGWTTGGWGGGGFGASRGGGGFSGGGGGSFGGGGASGRW
jgi:uncharacterized protein